MPYYAVLVRGSGVWLRELETRWLGLRRRPLERRCGFYTTRFFAADAPDDAERQALALVPEEVRRLHANRQGESFRLFIEEVRALREAPERMPGGGFTWFAEGEGDGGDTRAPPD